MARKISSGSTQCALGSIGLNRYISMRLGTSMGQAAALPRGPGRQNECPRTRADAQQSFGKARAELRRYASHNDIIGRRLGELLPGLNASEKSRLFRPTAIRRSAGSEALFSNRRPLSPHSYLRAPAHGARHDRDRGRRREWRYRHRGRRPPTRVGSATSMTALHARRAYAVRTLLDERM